jgi:hypothetical protein
MDLQRRRHCSRVADQRDWERTEAGDGGERERERDGERWTEQSGELETCTPEYAHHKYLLTAWKYPLGKSRE